MKHPTYFAVLGRRDPFGARRILERRACEFGLAPIHTSDGLSLFSDGPETLDLNGAGSIVGSIFRNAPGMPYFHPDLAERVATVTSRGSLLTERCWGDYLAFLAPPDEDELIVVRPPFTDLGAVHMSFRGLTLVASTPLLLSKFTGEAPEPHWSMIANHLKTGGMRQSESCLAGIEELLYGTRLVVTATGASVESAWSPWNFAASRRSWRPNDLADLLRETAIHVVEARLRRYGHVAVMLSGGLDSSILAACAAGGIGRLSCVNFTTGDRVGDEVDYAELVANRLGASIHSMELGLGDVDVGTSQVAHLARPIARSWAQAISAAKQRLAARLGAEVIVDGGGGDNIFCFLQSAAPVADRIRCEGIGRGALRTAGDVAEFTESSLARVLTKAAHRAWIRSPDYRWSCDLRYLTASALERAGEPRHRWLRPPPEALPGASAHIAVIAIVENLLETFVVERPEGSPLMAQPLVEVCLSVPTWLWFERGHNRALARRAFRELLPAEIVERRSKGTPDGFVARVYDANRPALRDLLCGGRLAAEGLLDRDAIDSTLKIPGPVKGHDHIRLLRIADVEAWVRSL